MPSPLLLAIETSQHVGGIALRDRRGIAHVEMLAPKKRHDDDLMPAIDRLFARHGLSPRDLAAEGSAVAVSIGPGGFTGLRIAVSAAKMFAETLGVRIIAAPTALVVAHGCREAGPILVALASKGETCWQTRLERTGGRMWTITGEPGLVDASSIRLEGIESLLGDQHLPESIRRACERMRVPIVEPNFDPCACLEAAEQMASAGEFTDPLLLSPLYPRQPEAVTLWEQKAR